MHKRLALAIFGAIALVSEGKITVWCLLGKKAGDNTQVLALARELGFGYIEKTIVARPWELLTHLTAGATLAGIEQPDSSPLEAPWPDLVIGAGRRNEPVARWIKQQSGGRARLVHIGRPWAPLATWDLVVTTPQYFLPQQDNILHNTLPLHRMPEDELAGAGERLRPQLAGLPRPWIGVLMGGDSGRFVMTVEKGERLGAMATDLAAAAGGALLVTDSPRTPGSAGDALQAQLSGPHFCYRWGDAGDNPYRGLLALADAFVVTGESMSMLGEAAAMGKPLFIFDLGDGEANWWSLAHSYRYKPLSHRFAMRFGPHRMRRDIGNIQSAMVGNGSAAWLEPAMISAAAAGLKEPSASLKEPSALPKERQSAGPTAIRETASGTAGDELHRTVRAVRQIVMPR
ncbi:MAG: nucleoside-diphosphate sugar epimerase [Gammaproteobacteria bacterium]|nr:MAG: nucleoside-diphosphate sugar epimerase [Gammaproteobacteria bacterium]RLA62172.1 MAG: nucleoside-diphosphate sugar epimerase [Gammaproteobacteria bacterium]